MKTLAVLLLGSIAMSAVGQRELAPRGAMLTGTADYDSARGLYVITLPPPNECVDFPPIRANSRGDALYRVMSAGGFTLKHSDAGLTVWTIEEWEKAKKELSPTFWLQMAEHCKVKK